jgi:membrane protease subunit HflC
MRKVIVGLLVVAAALWLLRSSLFAVDRTEFAYLTTFGRHVATFDGASDDEAGLHFKLPWPIQSVERLDRRLQVFDLPGAELLTHDPRGNTIDRTLTVDAYVCWRIADRDGVDRFLRTVGTPERARTILGGRVSSQLGAAIGHMELEDLISVTPQRVDEQRERLRQQLLTEGPDGGLAGAARRDYGIELTDIRLRRSNHPPAVREAIFDRIRSERNKKVAEYQSEGAREAEKVRSDADLKVRNLLTEARAEEQRLKGEADAEADRIRNQAHAQDVQFYAFLKKLEEYQRILGDNRSLLLLSTHRELFDLLLQPPKPGATTPSKPIADGSKPGATTGTAPGAAPGAASSGTSRAPEK